MDEEALFEALDEKPTVPNNNQSNYNNYKSNNGYNKRPNNMLWEKTDFKPTPVNSNKFNRTGKSFVMYGFVPYDTTVPEEVIMKFTKIATHLAGKGYTYRYCGTERDTIQNAVLSIENLSKKTYLGWPNCNPNIKEPTMKYANELGYSTTMAYHNGFLKFKPAGRALLAAKTHAMLGENVDNPTNLIIVYNSTGDIAMTKETNWKNMGDIGLFMKIAKDASIPLFNIGNEKNSLELTEYLKSLTQQPS